MIENLDLSGVTIEYNEFHIDFNKPLSEQIWGLNEDLLQFSIGEDFIIDVGYYPSHELNGKFRVVAIKNYDWENPIFKNTCSLPQSLPSITQEIIDKVIALNE